MAAKGAIRSIWLRRPWLGFGLVILASIALASFVDRGRGRGDTHHGPAAGALWIWAGDFDPGKPLGFYVVRDFDLETVPASARFWITAEESYHLFVNGAWIGTHRRRPADPADAYEVGPYLVAGRNRVVIELRSKHGGGGLRAALRAPGVSEPLVVTDEGWTMLPAFEPGLFASGPLPATGEPVQARPDRSTGRWRVGTEPRPRPNLLLPGAYGNLLRPRRVARNLPGKRWVKLRPDRLRLPRRIVGDVTVFDWGRTVVGYPILDLQGSQTRTALLYLSEHPETITSMKPELVITVDGAHHWHDVQPRRFRYLRILGVTLDRPPMALVVDQDVVEASMPSPPPAAGVFGLMLPEDHGTPAEREVLERFMRQHRKPDKSTAPP